MSTLKLEKIVADFNRNTELISGNIEGRNKLLQERYELTAIEINAFFWYKGHGSKLINYIIRFNSKEKNRIGEHIIDALKSALQKLPKATDHKTYRHDDIDDEIIKKNIVMYSGKVGKCFSINRFLSTSRIKNFAGNPIYYPQVSEIHLSKSGTKGVDIKELYDLIQQKEVEGEILFPPGTLFKLLSVMDKDELKFVLEEIENIDNDELIPSLFK